ncbi:eukaryotic translation initiation factor 3 subunit [Stylonychia lemnae]|uniref:Eukaryotic translation initiation factor 3 subunit n=1 Tax=Stylonychia lemnae TaxID=5949 RepID=A0A077ZPF3_STYLE|nr:eukaryotic translation initiation factor 3 subunit [Stylonychia lemnae]|eukprot:CDW71842.1 eukaryotic translation initiation factor 3 subunit [Stylonychia lemnae]
MATQYSYFDYSDQKQPKITIGIVDLNQNLILIDYQQSQFEMIIELREYLRDYIKTCFMTNYYFEYEGKELNDFYEFKNIISEYQSKQESSGQNNFNFKDFFAQAQINLGMNQSFANNQYQQHQQQTLNGNKRQNQIEYLIKFHMRPYSRKSSANSDQSFDSIFFCLSLYLDQYDSYQNDGYLDDSKLLLNVSQHNILNLINEKPTDKNRSQNNEQINKVLQKIQLEKCENDCQRRDIQKSYFYKIFVTIEKQEYQVIACESGFYISDDSTLKTSYTLPGLLCHISKVFKKQFENHLKQLCKHDPYKALTKCGGINQKQQWFKSFKDYYNENKKINYQNEELISNKEYETGIYGLDFKHGSTREWNDEYQQCKELPKDTQMQRIQRKRTIQKIYSDFVECAKIGAVKVIQGNVSALNPNDPPLQQIYIYNNIFFSYCADSPFDFKDNIPTYAAVNGDLNGIQKLENLDIDGLYTLATCLVKFMGSRIVCQSIMPGILSFSSQEVQCEYGSSNNNINIGDSSDMNQIVIILICNQLLDQENKVLACFLKSQAINSLIKDGLMVPEGGPTDSESLTSIFHFHGVNMRYLGLVLTKFRQECQEKNLRFKHIDFLLEKEIFIRSIKHSIINHRMLNDSQDSDSEEQTEFESNQHLSELDFLILQEEQERIKAASKKQNKKKGKNKKKKTKLESSDSKKSSNVSQNTIEFSSLQCVISTDCEKSSDWSNKSTINQSSSRKGSQFSSQISDLQEISAIPNDEMIINQDSKYFSVQNENNLFQQLDSKKESDILFKDITPDSLFELLNLISKAQICKIFGITIEQKDYHLENVQNLCFDLNPQYEWLPFQYTNIIEFLPNVKQISHQNIEVDNIMAQANKAFKDNLQEVAFDLYAQCVSIHVQLQGPLQKEAFDCLQRMSRIIYLQSDINMAIDLQIKAIQISTVLFGIDHSSTAYAISTLALYYQQVQEHEKSIQLLEKAILIFTVVEGENHPDIAATYVTLGYLFQELDMLYEALDSFFEAIIRFKDLMGEENIQIASCYSAIAVTYFHLDELRTALDYQEKSHAILLKLQSQTHEDPQQQKIYGTYLESSNQLVSYYAGCCIQREKALRMNQQHMSTRQCKRALSKPGSQMLPQNLNFLDLLEYNRFIQSTLEQRL